MNRFYERSVNELTDEEILEHFQEDAQNALSLLLDSYTPLVYTIVYNKINTVCSQEDIEECVSDIFYKFYLQVFQIDLTKGSIKSYLSTIAKRHSINLYQSRFYIKNAPKVALDLKEHDLPDLKNNIEEGLLQKENRQQIMEAVKSLGEPDSEIFIRKYFEGQNTKEIADQLALKPNTVDKKISRGLRKLKMILGAFLLSNKLRVCKK